MNQIFPLKKTDLLLKNLQAKNSRIVLVGGVFDIVHPGHVEFLERAKKVGDVLVVLLESDRNVEVRKGKNKPVNSQQDRAKVLGALRAVDYVICLPFMKKDQDYDQVIKQIQPQVIATTDGDPGIADKQRTAKLVGAKVKIVSKLLGEYSSGKIISKIRQFTETPD